MAVQTMKKSEPVPFSRIMETYVLLRAHPRLIVFHTAGAIWFIYFLWNRSWVEAVFSLLFAGIVGLSTVRLTDTEKIATTTLGRLALLHLHPANLLLQLAGIAPFIYGLWTHSTQLILIGLTLVVLGHSFGWSAMDERFAPKSR